MPTRSTPSTRRTLRARPRQRGVVMIITLIALALLMLAAAAMVRSVDTSSVLAGNLAFRRDLSNQAERGIVAARKLMVDGTVTPETTNLATHHYSAVKLANNANGVPSVLASDTAFAAQGMTDSAAVNGVTVRYVIDRQCDAGTTTFDPKVCEALEDSPDSSGTNWLRRPGGPARPIYRISVRVTGPRNAQSYYQATFAF